jgi:hypothetical protein
MPVTTRQQVKKEEMCRQSNQPKMNHANNHANIDFEDASKEWRRNKVKHENCWFTYTHNHE